MIMGTNTVDTIIINRTDAETGFLNESVSFEPAICVEKPGFFSSNVLVDG